MTSGTAPRFRLHRAWLVAFAAFVALVGAAGFRAAPSVLMDPLHMEFGWSHSTISAAVSMNLILYGLFSPFAAALMERLGMRRVVAAALVLVAAGSGLTVFMTEPWQLLLCWGVLVGIGTGSMALAFVATVTGRWFVRHRGLVSGVLTAASAAGQLVFLPLIAALATHHGWRSASLLVAGGALVVVPIVVIFLRDHPADTGTTAYGATEPAEKPAPARGTARRALTVLRDAAKTRVFWLLAGGFAICGASTNGLVGTHFVPAAHEHGMPPTTAASLLALVGIFDVAGTIASGWFTDRVDPRKLLGGYYLLRGFSLLLLPHLFAPTTEPPMWAFIIFYGLDWVATVPPTVALCRERFGMTARPAPSVTQLPGERCSAPPASEATGAAPIVFGWVFASHQIGASIAAEGAGIIHDSTGSYDLAWYLAGGLCALAAVLSISIPTAGLQQEPRNTALTRRP